MNDDSDPDGYWGTFSSGSGSLGVPTLSDETAFVARDVNSLKIVPAAGAFGVVGVEHTYGGNQDWSAADFLGFWWYGSGSGVTITVAIYSPDSSNYSSSSFVDNFYGYRRFIIPLRYFSSTGSPSLSTVKEVIFSWTVNPGTIYLDRVVADAGTWINFESQLPDRVKMPSASGISLYSWNGSEYNVVDAADIYTKLLCPFDIDYSDFTGVHTLTNTNCSISSSIKKFGAGSCYFDGTAALTISPYADMQLGSSDWTIETWAYFPVVPATWGKIFAQGIIANSLVMGMFGWNDVYKLFTNLYVGSSNIFTTMSSSFSLSTNTWYHIRFVRQGSNWYQFFNGFLVGAITNATAVPTMTYPPTIGAWLWNGSTLEDFITAYLDDYHVTFVALSTTDYTPPTSPCVYSPGGFYFLDGSKSVNVYSGTSGIKRFMPNVLGATAYGESPDAASSLVYTNKMGCKNRFGLSVKMPPATFDGLYNALDASGALALNKTQLKIVASYEDDSTTWVD